MSAVLGGLRRLVRAPGLWLGAWLVLAVVAAVLGRAVAAVVAAAVGPFSALDPDRVVVGLVDVLVEHRAAAAAVLAAVLAGTVLSALGWMLLSPLVIARLAGSRPWAEVGTRAVRSLPAVIVQTVWHGGLRAALVLAGLLSVQALPGVAVWGLLALVWLVCGVALDATRVAVVEHEAGPWHIRAALGGFGYCLRRPALLLPCALMGLGQLALAATGLWLALAGLSGGSPWGPRLLALASVGLGLWRVGTVVHRLDIDPP